MVLKRESASSKEALPDENIDCCQENVDLFYRFVNKRYNIYVRRFIRKRPTPWTKDPILQEYKFTNVYRKLDRSSKWMIEYIIESEGFPRLSDKVWGCIFYRINNNIETFQEIGIPLRRDFKPKKYQKLMEAYKDAGNRVFTNAHITCQSNLKRSRIENFIEITTRLKKSWKKEIWPNIKKFRKKNDWEGCFKFIKTLYGFGGFTSYEVCIDMVYAGVFPDDIRDSFANTGPGCEYGLQTMFPNRQFISFEGAMRKLTDEQRENFIRLGIKYHGPRLMIQDIEFSLCEFGKYWKVKKGVGKPRMRFKPKTIIS